MNLSEIANLINNHQRYKAVEKLVYLVEGKECLEIDWFAVARLAVSVGEISLAKQAVSRFLGFNDKNLSLIVACAALLAESGQFNEALSLLTPFASEAKHSAPLAHLLGTLYSQQGDAASANQYFNQALAIWPNSGKTWLSLFALAKVNHQDLLNINSVEKQIESADALSQASYYYAKGKAYVDVKNSAEAVKAFQLGAAIMQRHNPYDADRDHAYCKALINSFRTEQSVEDLAKSALPVKPPIFILGLPRSGTTLVEQILASHSLVKGGGESDLIRKATMEMKGVGSQFARRYQQQFDEPQHAWEHLASTYIYLANQRFKGEGRILDKTLNNSRALGIITRMFPTAPVIWLRRDPVDAAWSCFRTFFSGNLPWSWSLEAIAKHFANEDALYEHWSKLYPDNILSVQYEDLVSQPENVTCKILEHCQLPFEKQVLSSHQTQRVVTSASSLQVRQAVNTNAVGGSKEFAEFMQPFVQTYQRMQVVDQ